MNIPGIRGGPGGRDRTLAIKTRKKSQKSAFVKKNFFIDFLSYEKERKKKKKIGGNNDQLR